MKSQATPSKHFEKSRYRSLHLAVLLVGSLLAALMVFVRAPEEVHISSIDGRVQLSGLAPRRLGLFRVNKIESIGDKAYTSLVAPVYNASPSNVMLPLPLQLSITYDPKEIGDHNPVEVRIVQFNEAYGRWEFLSSTVDLLTHTVNAEVRVLSTWSLAVPEDPGIPPELVDLVTRLKEAPPAQTVGYVVDLEYAKAVEDYVLYHPAYLRGGCRGFFNGEEEQKNGQVITLGTITYRATITWEIGDLNRCNR